MFGGSCFGQNLQTCVDDINIDNTLMNRSKKSIDQIDKENNSCSRVGARAKEEVEQTL